MLGLAFYNGRRSPDVGYPTIGSLTCGSHRGGSHMSAAQGAYLVIRPSICSPAREQSGALDLDSRDKMEHADFLLKNIQKRPLVMLQFRDRCTSVRSVSPSIPFTVAHQSLKNTVATSTCLVLGSRKYRNFYIYGSIAACI